MIEDSFIEKHAEEYMKCKVKPFPTFEQYLEYCWFYYQRFLKNIISKGLNVS